MKGLELHELLAYYRGLGWVGDPYRSGVFPMQILIGDQTLHAVGAGVAFALRGEPRVAVAIVGDGATSQGDFHEGLNFAGVFRARAVVFIANNQWAISMPRARQSRSATLAEKAVAHGIAGVLVDGNDPLAVYAVARDAIERARAGAGPVLVEALTYRMGAHTTADDPTRYQPPEEIQQWAQRDPMLRTRRFLEARGLWDEAQEAAARAEALAQVDAAMARCEALPLPPFREALAANFASPTAPLREQMQEVDGTA
jgi:pyruvate dehydrogenase E1 component alpha subunit